MLVEFRTAAHSILDTREAAALQIMRAAVDGHAGELASRAGEPDELPGNISVRLLVAFIEAAAAVEKRVPGTKPIA